MTVRLSWEIYLGYWGGIGMLGGSYYQATIEEWCRSVYIMDRDVLDLSSIPLEGIPQYLAKGPSGVDVEGGAWRLRVDRGYWLGIVERYLRARLEMSL